MAIFKAIEENTLPTEPIARGATTTPKCTGIWRATWSTGFMTLETVAFAFGLNLVGDTLLCGSDASQEQAIVEEAPPCGPIAEYCGAELRRDC